MAAVYSCTFHGSPHGRRAHAILVLGWGAPEGTVQLKLVHIKFFLDWHAGVLTLVIVDLWIAGT